MSEEELLAVFQSYDLETAVLTDAEGFIDTDRYIDLLIHVIGLIETFMETNPDADQYEQVWAIYDNCMSELARVNRPSPPDHFISMN